MNKNEFIEKLETCGYQKTLGGQSVGSAGSYVVGEREVCFKNVVHNDKYGEVIELMKSNKIDYSDNSTENKGTPFISMDIVVIF